MTVIFPGMNPYLEHPELFPGVHHWLIIEIARFLSPQLRPKYRVAVEVRMYETTDNGANDSLLVGIPDVVVKTRQNRHEHNNNVALATSTSEPLKVRIPVPIAIKEGYLEIKEVGTEKLVTTIEILSPTNKRLGKGRRDYIEKREKVLGSLTNLVEIDLLREGQFMPILSEHVQTDYRILISRSDNRPIADLYAFNLPDVIPTFPLPLQAGDIEPIIDLQTLLSEIYDISGYDLVLDYGQEPVPILSVQNAAWMDNLLRGKGLRVNG